MEDVSRHYLLLSKINSTKYIVSFLVILGRVLQSHFPNLGIYLLETAANVLNVFCYRVSSKLL